MNMTEDYDKTCQLFQQYEKKKQRGKTKRRGTEKFLKFNSADTHRAHGYKMSP